MRRLAEPVGALLCLRVDDETGEVDERKIDFHYRQAGLHGFFARRIVTFPEAWVAVDDRRYDLLFGEFFPASGQIRIRFCGPNLRG